MTQARTKVAEDTRVEMEAKDRELNDALSRLVEAEQKIESMKQQVQINQAALAAASTAAESAKERHLGHLTSADEA